MPLDGSTDANEAAIGADRAANTSRKSAPGFAPTSDNRGLSGQFSTIGTADAHETDEDKKCEKPEENSHFPGVLSVSDQWAMSDLNQRLPPCKGERLHSQTVAL